MKDLKEKKSKLMKKLLRRIAKLERKSIDADSVLEGFSKDETRKHAEAEACCDLMKPIEQLLSDVHDEALQGRSPTENIIHVNKRMTSMMTRVAKSNNRLSWIIIIFTGLLILIELRVLKALWEMLKSIC